MTDNSNTNHVNHIPHPDDDLASPITLISIWSTMIIVSLGLFVLAGIGIYHLMVCG